MLKLFVLLLLLEECTWPRFHTLPSELLVYESMTVFSDIDWAGSHYDKQSTYVYSTFVGSKLVTFFFC